MPWSVKEINGDANVIARGVVEGMFSDVGTCIAIKAADAQHEVVVSCECSNLYVIRIVVHWFHFCTTICPDTRVVETLYIRHVLIRVVLKVSGNGVAIVDNDVRSIFRIEAGGELLQRAECSLCNATNNGFDDVAEVRDVAVKPLQQSLAVGQEQCQVEVSLFWIAQQKGKHLKCSTSEETVSIASGVPYMGEGVLLR